MSSSHHHTTTHNGSGRRRSPPPKNTIPTSPLPSEEWLLERAKKRASLPLASYWRDLLWPPLPSGYVPLFEQRHGLEKVLRSLKKSTEGRERWWSDEQQQEEESSTLKGKQMFERKEPVTRKRPRPVTAAEVMTEKEIQAQRQKRAQDEAAFMASLKEKIAYQEGGGGDTRQQQKESTFKRLE